MKIIICIPGTLEEGKSGREAGHNLAFLIFRGRDQLGQ